MDNVTETPKQIDYLQRVVPTDGMVQIAKDASNNDLDILHAENGLASGAVCKICGGAMVAKQGDVIAWHFAHHIDSDCAGGGEGARHHAAKKAVAALLGGKDEVYFPGDRFIADVYAGGIYFEIVDTSPPSAEKQAFLDETNLPVVYIHLPREESGEIMVHLLERAEWVHPDVDQLKPSAMWAGVARGIAGKAVKKAQGVHATALAAAATKHDHELSAALCSYEESCAEVRQLYDTLTAQQSDMAEKAGVVKLLERERHEQAAALKGANEEVRELTTALKATDESGAMARIAAEGARLEKAQQAHKWGVEALATKQQKLDKERDAVDAKLRSIGMVEWYEAQYMGLQRDLDVTTELYDQLRNAQPEAQLRRLLAMSLDRERRYKEGGNYPFAAAVEATYAEEATH